MGISHKAECDGLNARAEFSFKLKLISSRLPGISKRKNPLRKFPIEIESQRLMSTQLSISIHFNSMENSLLSEISLLNLYLRFQVLQSMK